MSCKREKEGKNPFIAWLKRRFSLPHLGDSHFIEVRCRRGNKEAFLSSVEHIVSYSSSEIILRFCGENIVFSGEKLYLSAYRSGVVSIEGKIQSITVKGVNNVAEA